MEKPLIRLLRKNSRTTLSSLSKTLKVPVSTLSGKIRQIKGIKRHSCLLSNEGLGFPIHAIIVIEKNDGILSKLLVSPHTNNLYKFKNKLFFEGFFRNLSELDWFCERLQRQNLHYSKYLVTKTLKREAFMV